MSSDKLQSEGGQQRTEPPSAFLFAEEIHKAYNLLTDKAFLFARKIRSDMSEKPTNQFEDAHDLILSYIDTKKNIKIFCGYKKGLYICIVKRCGDFRKTLKNEQKWKEQRKSNGLC